MFSRDHIIQTSFLSIFYIKSKSIQKFCFGNFIKIRFIRPRVKWKTTMDRVSDVQDHSMQPKDARDRVVAIVADCSRGDFNAEKLKQLQ